MLRGTALLHGTALAALWGCQATGSLFGIAPLACSGGVNAGAPSPDLNPESRGSFAAGRGVLCCANPQALSTNSKTSRVVAAQPFAIVHC